MGSTLVATMIQAHAEGHQARKLHPFFSRPSDAPSETETPPPQPATEETTDAKEDAASLPDSEGPGSDRKRNSDEAAVEEDISAPKKQQRRKRTSGRNSLNESITNHFIRSNNAQHAIEFENMPSEAIPTPPLSDGSILIAESHGIHSSSIAKQPATPTRSASVASTSLPANTKVLRFNTATGTLGSPPKPKKASPPSRIITIKYGLDEGRRVDLGRRIKDILETPLPQKSKPRRGRPPKGARKPDANPATEEPRVESSTVSRAKSPVRKTAPKEPVKRHTISMATPVSPRKQRPHFPPERMANFGQINPIGTTRVPGAKYPSWPNQGMAHVRGDDGGVSSRSPSPNNVGRLRKFKGQVVAVNPEESVVDQLAQQLCTLSVQIDQSQCQPIPQDLRLPERRFESGRKLQSRIRKQLWAPARIDLPNDLEDELAGSPYDQPVKIHPAISRLYTDLQSSLSAYDRSTCENCVWVHKYAPSKAEHVLQSGREAFYLKDWLETLKVQAVDTGNNDTNGTNGRLKGDKAPKKRRKKNKLDGFIVDSGSEEDILDEVSDDDPDWAPSNAAQGPKTIIRSVGRNDQSRCRNAVVISGPHGCGKTAAVYGVAQELGYEIFEINSASRRSGKDLLEKVGDMTRNHLVQQHQAGAPAAEGDVEDEVSKDLKSGKQGTMTTFFKPKSGDPKLPKMEKRTGPDPKPETRSKAQKQSLILLEEVDVLYEEDKQFWATLMGMIAQSKRPFVMTCNDESLIPIQSLALHGILRFSPPPTNLAVDVCLLVAANEGHSLERGAVEALYMSRSQDLRATIADLNFWCQLGVGDQRGGFDWFYLRWPKGSDLDENGDVVRVVSENTYLKGMGWLARDSMVPYHYSQPLQQEEEAIHQCLDSWQLALGDWHTSMDMTSCTKDMSNDYSKSRQLHDLDAYVQFCDNLSDADLCCDRASGKIAHDIIDPSLPEMTAKAKEDFILGRQLLEADPLRPMTGFDREIATSLAGLARQDLYKHALATQKSIASEELRPVSEGKAVSVLESSFQSTSNCMTRFDLALAFDPIAVPDSGASTSYLDPSVFDRTLKMIVLDVAPWVRSIVAYDDRLLHERKKLSSLLSEGGQKKRMRNTRSAYSALEGGERKSTRRDKYFKGSINSALVMRTGLPLWRNAAEELLATEAKTEEGSSVMAEQADENMLMESETF